MQKRKINVFIIRTLEDFVVVICEVTVIVF